MTNYFNNNPPQLRRGLINLGNTCYLNSTLQSLFNIKAFVEWLQTNEPHRSVCKESFLNNQKELDQGCFICCLFETFENIQNGNLLPMAPHKIYNRIKLISSTFIIGEQEDANECYLGILNAIKASMSQRFYLNFNTSQEIHLNEALMSVFECEKSITMTCKSCMHSTDKTIKEFPLEISTNIASSNIKSIQDGIAKQFMEYKLNDYTCLQCGAKNVFQVERILKIPCVLFIRLNRFSLGRKISKAIDITKDLVLTPFLSDTHEFTLSSYICHKGSFDRGHYKTFNIFDTGVIEYDDHLTTIFNYNKAEAKADIYIAVYEKSSSPNNTKLIKGTKRKISIQQPDNRPKKLCTKLELEWGNNEFKKKFLDNTFGHACCVCDRLWFVKDTHEVNDSHIAFLHTWNDGELLHLNFDKKVICSNCKQFINKSEMPQMAKWNGFQYPDIPTHLPPLNIITERLIAPRIAFMQIRRLRRDFSYGILGQVINVPVDVPKMIYTLPRNLEDDYAINVNIKRNLLHKSNYLSGYVKKEDIKVWLEFLVESTLYQELNITFDVTRLNYIPHTTSDKNDDIITVTNMNSLDHVKLMDLQQQSVVWNESSCLNIAPGQLHIPLNIIYDQYAEELTFPGIYLGEKRKYREGLKISMFTTSTSEIRRLDRRSAVPQKILYMAVRNMRMRVVEGIQATFRSTEVTKNVTRKMIQDKTFLDEALEKNFAFLKSIPNSVQYWDAKKRDLFSMFRQLGKPTLFLTLTANEVGWNKLIKILLKLSKAFPDIDIKELTSAQKTFLVCNDPVVCCVYFKRMVDIFLSILSTKSPKNPWGEYFIKDYFIRNEFQQRGSPHSHIIIWVNNSPNEPLSEKMPKTIAFIDSLITVDTQDFPDMDLLNHQNHKHTFTCTKRGEKTCRFNIPFWPSPETCILLPLRKEDPKYKEFQLQAKKIRFNLETVSYKSLKHFFEENKIGTYQNYLNIVRSYIKKPTIILKRDITQCFVNPFNSWLLANLNSNMDIQFIVNEMSCAAYIVDYVNKSDRGIGSLRRKLYDLYEKNPEKSEIELIKMVAKSFLNCVEMSAQEAAWYLLRQPMSVFSRNVLYIPTCLPAKRYKLRKTKLEMDNQSIDDESTDIWRLNIIEKYEDRPATLNDIYLAEFVSHYNIKTFKKKKKPSIITYNNYKINDLNNYKRERVLLFLEFNNELSDILDRENYLKLYDDNLDKIVERSSLYETNFDINIVMEQIKALEEINIDDDNVDENCNNIIVTNMNYDLIADDTDIDNIHIPNPVLMAEVGKKNCLTPAEYCNLMRTTNPRQREIILEVINRIFSPDAAPIQVFFTGPAGCGKTYTIKLITETYNRFYQLRHGSKDAYIVCGSTGKAAVAIGGTTVHSLFNINPFSKKQTGNIKPSSMAKYVEIFEGVKCIIVDEVSMLSARILRIVNDRLQQIGNSDPFGGYDIFLCGDIRQLGAVNALPIYASTIDSHPNFEWQYLEYFPLYQIVRQSDTTFSNILTKIGNGESLNKQEITEIESCHRTKQWCMENKKDVVRLFYSNAEVNEYNLSVYKNGIPCKSNNVITGASSEKERKLFFKKLKDMEPNIGLPFLIYLVLGYSYVINTNIDVSDGLVNGAVGILKFIEEREECTTTKNNIDSEEESNLEPDFYKNGKEELSPNIILWFEFETENVGLQARNKCRKKNIDIQKNWVPIKKKICTFDIQGPIKCRRKQFPISPACAMTVHKSQGGTFPEVVYQYNKNHSREIVYVALSRVSSKDGLYITTKDDVPLKFSHSKYDNSSKHVRGIRSEFLRLNSHKLETLTAAALEFLNNPGAFFIFNINIQSLAAHIDDLISDEILSKANFLILSETWMCSNTTIDIRGYTILSSCNLNKNYPAVGGVAMYMANNSSYKFTTLDVNINEIKQDCCVGVLEGIFGSIIIGSLYIHPNTTQSDIYKVFEIFLDLIQKNNSLPTILLGDFNIDVLKCPNFLLHIKNKYNFTCVNKNMVTTRYNTCIDLTFVNSSFLSLKKIDCFSYVSYFSYHRPILNKLNL